VTVEGFRGFTGQQTIPVDGKHLFLFCPNGRGKSSVIEAVRWCLFGSSEKDIEVRNTFYTQGDCKVILDLDAPSGPLQIGRELRAGYLALLDCAVPVFWMMLAHDHPILRETTPVRIASLRAAKVDPLSDECTSEFADLVIRYQSRLANLTFRILCGRALRGQSL
jgi:hypothetical protein